MRAYGKRNVAAVVLIALAAMATAIAQDGYNEPSKVNIAWNQLYDYDQLVQHCRDLASAYPDLLTMETIGQTVEGREMVALTLNVEATGPHDSKPAIYIDGNIHGNEVQASEVVLYTIWYLTKSYGKVPQLTELMDRVSFYFIPSINPDGRAYWFAAPNDMHSSRTGAKPIDNDQDGRFDEDPPNDLDGDGNIVRMRIEDPAGDWREHPDDPRVMIRIDPEAKGDFKRYRLLGREGIDDDGDGRINEDGKGGYDPNRNWPAGWQPNFIQFGAGEFPLSLPESQAVARFILARPNIAAAQAYHNAGGMILRGPGAKEVEYDRRDLRVYEALSKRGEKIIPFYDALVVWKDLYPVYGGFFNWCYEDLGIISFTNELWTGRKYYGAEDNAGQKERMEFNDYVMFGRMFVPWKKIEHPDYGEVEIGGWVKMTGRIPPSFHLEEECHRNFAFTMYHADQMPLVEIAATRVASLPGGLFRVQADVRNTRLIPTVTAQGRKRQYGPRDFIEISGDDLRVIAGGRMADKFLGPFDFVEHMPQKLWIDDGVPGDGELTFQWIVSGSGAAKIRFDSPRARAVEAEVALGG